MKTPERLFPFGENKVLFLRAKFTSPINVYEKTHFFLFVFTAIFDFLRLCFHLSETGIDIQFPSFENWNGFSVSHIMVVLFHFSLLVF